MVKGLWGRIALITFLKLVTLVGTAEFAQIISGFLGNIASPALSASNAGSAVHNRRGNIFGGTSYRRGGIPLHGKGKAVAACGYILKGIGA